MPFRPINVRHIIADQIRIDPAFKQTYYTIIKGELTMTKNITLTPAEIQTLLTACMAAIAHYCVNDAEAEPYKAMIERLEELEVELNTHSKGYNTYE